MQLGVMITNGGTHHPANYADYILDQLVPAPLGISQAGMEKVMAARAKMRPSVEAAMTACRAHEQAAWDRLSYDDKDRLVDAVKNENTLGVLFHDSPVYKSHEYWIDGCVQEIAKAARECDGDKLGHNEMIDYIYQTLTHWIRTLTNVERRHSVTSRGLTQSQEKE